MRNMTTTERNRLSASHANFYLKVETLDSEDNWRDLTSLSGIDYVDGVTISASIDNPTMTGTITLKREHHNFSLSPLVTGSALNKDSHGAYAPLLDAGRAVRISTAVTAHGVAPITADWKFVFVGVILAISFESDPISIDISDIGQALIDAQIEALRVYGDPVVGTAVEDVIQNIIDDNMGAGLFPLFVPVSPNYEITNFAPDLQGVYSAIDILVLQLGWDIRYQFDSSDIFRLTLIEPDRAKTTPDATIGPDEYLKINRLNISNADVRNVCDIYFVNKISGLTDFATASDSGSLAEFGRRYMRITYGSTDQIDTATEAQTMADAAISDLAQPLADLEVEQFYFWPVQLGDLLKYSANATCFDSDQTFGVVGYTHTLSAGSHRTAIQVRGKVAGAYRDWLLAAGSPTGSPPISQITTGPAPEIFPLLGESEAYQDGTRDGMAWLQMRFDKHTSTIEVYSIEDVAPNLPIPELSTSRLSYSIRRQEGDKWSGDDVAFIVPIATRTSYYRKTVSFGVGYGFVLANIDGSRGPTVVSEVQALDSGVGPSAPPNTFAIASTGTTNRITWVNGDASAYTILFRNGLGIVLQPGVTAFLDTSIDTSNSYTYSICHWKSGQSSDRIPSSGGGTGGGGGGGGTVTPPAQNANAPVWQPTYPQSVGTNGVDYRWTADPSATEVAIQLSQFILAGVWTDLQVFTDPTHVPSGAFTDTSHPAGSTYQARVRSLVAGVEYYSVPVNVVYGVPPLIAPKFIDGTPFNDGGSVDFEWETASTNATSLQIIIQGVSGGVFTTTDPAFIQSGNWTYPHAAGGKTVTITAFYPGGKSASSSARISTAL